MINSPGGTTDLGELIDAKMNNEKEIEIEVSISSSQCGE